MGVIESYLETKTETCVIEVWTQALSMTEKPNKSQSREIGAILDSLEGWERGEGAKRFEGYCLQRFWQRKITAELVDYDDNIIEIVDINAETDDLN